MPAATPPVNVLVVLMVLALLAAVVGSWVWVALRVAFRASILPRFEPRIVPWGGRSVLVALLLWLAIQIVGQIAFVQATHGAVRRPPGAPPILSPTEMMVASAIQNTAILIAVPLMLAVVSGARRRDFGLVGSWRRMGWRVLQGVGAWPLAAPVIYALMLAAVAIWGKQNHPLESAIQNEGVGRMAFLFFLAGAILAPAAEELIFRGILLGWLTRLVLQPRPIESADLLLVESDATTDPTSDDFAGGPGATSPDRDGGHPEDPAQASFPSIAAEAAPAQPDRPATSGQMVQLTVANVGVSILFAGLHYSVWPTPVPIFFLSLVLGMLYQRTGSLVAPIALHMTFNGISTVLMLLTVGMGIKVDPASPPKAPVPDPLPVATPATRSIGPGRTAKLAKNVENEKFVFESA